MSDGFLTKVLGQGEHIHELIRLSAEELSSANSMVNGFDQNEAVRSKLQYASERLAAMSQALRLEVKDRNMVDYQLAAAVEQEEGSRIAALHDNLTGLPNRVLFKDRLEHAIAQAKRHRWMLAVMFVDLDNFKSINDTYGHSAGDSVLQTVAARLKHHTGDDDTVSRYGGDEFLCLLTQLHEHKDIETIAANILQVIQAPCNVSVRDVIVNPCLGASIGVSVFPRDGATASRLIRSADESMYRAKGDKSGYAFAQ